MNNTNERELDIFVNNNVIYNLTSLVEDMLSSAHLQWCYENIDNYYNEEEDGNAKEILEWWLVNDWMAEKLKEHNECVLSNKYGEYWGRTCSGQAISMDKVIEKIYNSIVN